jgi:hypothetical protein
MTRYFTFAFVLLAMLLATTITHAQQGNLPVPLQRLPAYPPVVCVTIYWTPEDCDSRKPPKMPARSGVKTVLYDEPGGDYWVHWNRFRALAESGDDVEIRGSCASGCTLIMVHVPNDRLCFGEAASLKFHVTRDPKSGEPDMAFTQRMMVNQYPQDIRMWVIAKGGVEKMTTNRCGRSPLRSYGKWAIRNARLNRLQFR